MNSPFGKSSRDWVATAETVGSISMFLPGCRPLEPDELVHLAAVAVVVAVARVEADVIADVARVAPHRVDAPDLVAVDALEAERAERDGHLDAVAPVEDLPGRVPDAVPGVAVTVDAAGRVSLDAERIAGELVPAPLVVVRVYADDDPLVVPHPVVVAEVGVDRDGSGS